MSENATEIIKNVLIGQMCSLFDHQPIHLQVSFSKVQKGKVFWRMINELLTDFEFINGCNKVITNTLTQYSGQLRQLEQSQELSNDQYCNANFDISSSLLHDVVLMEAHSYIMKYEATKNGYA